MGLANQYRFLFENYVELIIHSNAIDNNIFNILMKKPQQRLLRTGCCHRKMVLLLSLIVEALI